MKAKYIRDNGVDDLTQDNVYTVTDNKDGCLEIIDDTGVRCWFVSGKFELIDTVVDSVVHQFKQRSKVGIGKYGVTMDRSDLSPLDWLIELQQELMDGVIYAERLKKDMQDGK